MSRLLSRAEVVPAALLALAFVAGALQSEYFLDPYYLLDSISLYSEAGILALGMTFVIVSGNIDLSVASMLALVACLVAKLQSIGLSMPFAAVCGLVVGALLGAFNGLLVAYTKFPSFLVTLGTLALFRGAAQALMGASSTKLPESFVGIDRIDMPFTTVPVPLGMFVALALGTGLVLHRSTLGRAVFATGGNEEAAAYSTLNPARIKMTVFVLSGVLAAVAALIMDSRLGVARYDHAKRMELDVITATVLGGASIYGGRGTMLGTVLALLLIAIVRTGMGVANVQAEHQLAVIGALLVLAVGLGSLFSRRRS